MKYFIFIFFVLFYFPVFAQLGFCTGSKSDPIFQEDFGEGTGYGPPLENGITSFKYVTIDPEDGFYAVTDVVGRQNTTWHSNFPNTRVSNGRALVVNADFTAGQFYEKKISGLCENTNYEFSAFLMNIYDLDDPVCTNGGIPVNVRFEIYDESGTVLLKSGSTGAIEATRNPEWNQYALTFKSKPGQNAIILRMFNNGDGGCGNDLAIDDIIFRTCGDKVIITSNGREEQLNFCETESPVSAELLATPDFSVYSEHFYQWQRSEDGTNWQNIPGETQNTYQTPPLNESNYFRVRVADNPANLGNDLCSYAADAFLINIAEKPEPPINAGDVSICKGQPTEALSVRAGPDETVNWYSAEEGGTLLAENTLEFIPNNPGTFYAEALKKDFDCASSTRTPVSLLENNLPQPQELNLELCPNTPLTLDAVLTGASYSWNTGATSKTIQVSRTGEYKVIISFGECKTSKTFKITAVDTAEIANINSRGNRISVYPENNGDFEYSLDGINFQASNIFNEVPAGKYLIFMRDTKACKTVSREFLHLIIPQYVTPNNDGYHDEFTIEGLSLFKNVEIRIYDRYGQLLKQGTNRNFSWDIEYEGKPYPSTECWYSIQIEEYTPIKGHFSIKR